MNVNKKKILFITKNFPPEIGGGIRRIEAVYDILRHHPGIKLDTVTNVKDTAGSYENVKFIRQLIFKDKTKDSSVRFKSGRADKIKLFDKAFAGWMPNVIRSVIFKKYDYVFASTPTFTNVLIAYIYTLLHRKCRLIVEYRDLNGFNPVNVNAANKDKICALETKILKKAYKVIVTTESMKKILSPHIGAKKISVIKNHMSTADKKTLDNMDNIEFQKEKYNIGYVGTLNTGRDPEGILKLAGMEYAGKNINLHFVGTNAKEEEFIKLIAVRMGICVDNLKFYGFVSREESLRYMKSFDALLLIINKQAAISDGYGIPGKLYDYVQANNNIISDIATYDNLKSDFDITITDKKEDFVFFKVNNDVLLDDILNKFAGDL